MTKLQEFTAFASRKPANERYEFMDACGGCAIGQWMKATGSEWNITAYQDLLREILNDKGPGPLASSETWGDLHSKLKELV